MPWFWNKDIQNDNNTFYVRNKGRKLYMILTTDFSITFHFHYSSVANVIVYIIPY